MVYRDVFLGTIVSSKYTIRGRSPRRVNEILIYHVWWFFDRLCLRQQAITYRITIGHLLCVHM